MARTVLQGFLSDRNLLAIRLGSRDVLGFLRKSFTTPRHTTGLAFFADGTRRLLEEARPVEGTFDLVLAKNSDIPVRFQFRDLRTADGLPVTVSCEIRFAAAVEREEFFADFCRHLLPFPGTCSAEDLRDHAEPEVRRILSLEAASRPAAALRGADFVRTAGKQLLEGLERHFFDVGIRVRRLAGLEVAAPAAERASGGGRPDRSRDEGAARAVHSAMKELRPGEFTLEPEEVGSSRADRLYAAAGSRVLEIDPSGVEPPRVHDFSIPLRSVRWAETPQGGLLLGGGRDRVAAILPGGAKERLEYPLPAGRGPRGGINAIACTAGFLYATHSEYGLARWPADRPGIPAEILYPEITTPHRTTRAVQTVDGKILFSSGPHVILAPADGEGDPLKYISSIESPVTCAAAAAHTIFAATENGTILGWRMDAPDQPVVLVRRREPVLHLRLVRLRSTPYLVYATRDLSVHARVIGQNVEVSYETGGAPIGALEAADDILGASEAGGRLLLLWRADAPSGPWVRIDAREWLDKPILDLWMRKLPVREGPHG